MDRYRVIERFAKQHNWTQGLELGVWVGVTTLWLMKNTDMNMTCSNGNGNLDGVCKCRQDMRWNSE